MKDIKYFLTIILLQISVFLGCSGNDDSATDQKEPDKPAITNYDTSSILSKFIGTGLSYEVKGDVVTFTTKNLPDHTSPYWSTSNPLYEAYNGTNSEFKKNPGSIGGQNIVFTISLKPQEVSVKQATGLGPIGIARNGVVFFNQYAAGDAPLTREINSFDQWHGHPAVTTYHYHIEPTYLTKQFGDDAFLGLLADGFPVYGPKENGILITNDDLDDFHGHTSVTADFPDGIYHYHITANDPYLNGNGYFGTPGNISK